MLAIFLPLPLASQLTIINITSAGAHIVAQSGSSYQTSKLAMCRFTEFLDAEYARSGLVAIMLNPGGVKTQLALSMPDWMQAILTDTVELATDTIL